MSAAAGDWRTSDVVAYDTMRESTNRVLAYLLDVSRTSPPRAAATADEQYAIINKRMKAIHGHDRPVVDAFVAEMNVLETTLAVAYDTRHSRPVGIGVPRRRIH